MPGLAVQSQPTTVLFVKGLPTNLGNDLQTAVEAVFRRCQGFRKCVLVRYKDTRRIRAAFVYFTCEATAAMARTATQGLPLGNGRLSVHFSLTKTPGASKRANFVFEVYPLPSGISPAVVKSYFAGCESVVAAESSGGTDTTAMYVSMPASAQPLVEVGKERGIMVEGKWAVVRRHSPQLQLTNVPTASCAGLHGLLNSLDGFQLVRTKPSKQSAIAFFAYTHCAHFAFRALQGLVLNGVELQLQLIPFGKAGSAVSESSILQAQRRLAQRQDTSDSFTSADASHDPASDPSSMSSSDDSAFSTPPALGMGGLCCQSVSPPSTDSSSSGSTPKGAAQPPPFPVVRSAPSTGGTTAHCTSTVDLSSSAPAAPLITSPVPAWPASSNIPELVQPVELLHHASVHSPVVLPVGQAAVAQQQLASPGAGRPPATRVSPHDSVPASSPPAAALSSLNDYSACSPVPVVSPDDLLLDLVGSMLQLVQRPSTPPSPRVVRSVAATPFSTPDEDAIPASRHTVRKV